jgi:glyoxylase I family protein
VKTPAQLGEPVANVNPLTVSTLPDGGRRRREKGTVRDLLQTMAHTTESRQTQHTFVKNVHGVRYQVKDVARSVAFYTRHLGFTLEHQQLPAFASISLAGTQILLSGPDASGSRAMPSGQRQEPGGWNRVVLAVTDLSGCIAELKAAGLRFRNDMETGPGGRQIQVEDPDGNPIELFEPARRTG